MTKRSSFIFKLFELVNDPVTNDLVSWETNGKYFIVHKPTEFSLIVLPHYFKHNNFASFVRQLNQYGFHKIHPDEWIFGHHDFKLGQQEKLKNICRTRARKLNENQNLIVKSVLSKEKMISEISLLKKYRNILTKNILDVCRRQENLLQKQKNFEKIQNKADLELNNLKSFIFGYFSRIISKDLATDKIKKYKFLKKDFREDGVNFPMSRLSRLNISFENLKAEN